jgi:hemerythrin-like domain-containing protein
VCLRALTDGLVAEHRVLEGHWAALREVLARIAKGEPVALPPSDVQAFVAAYAAHIEKEDTELLPMAARLLSDADITRIGTAMRVRRGIGEID